MHLAVEAGLVHDVGAVRLQRAPVVVQADACDAADEPVRHARGEAADEVVAALPAPAAHDVVALVDLREQEADVGGIVLEVAVHRHDHGAAGVVEAGGHRRRLAEVPPQADELEAVVRRGESSEPPVGVVTAAVVDHDHLERASEPLEARHERDVQRVDVVLLVVHRDDDRDVGRRRVAGATCERQRLCSCVGRAWNGHRGQYAVLLGRVMLRHGFQPVPAAGAQPPARQARNETTVSASSSAHSTSQPPRGRPGDGNPGDRFGIREQEHRAGAGREARELGARSAARPGSLPSRSRAGSRRCRAGRAVSFHSSTGMSPPMRSVLGVVREGRELLDRVHDDRVAGRALAPPSSGRGRGSRCAAAGVMSEAASRNDARAAPHTTASDPRRAHEEDGDEQREGRDDDPEVAAPEHRPELRGGEEEERREERPPEQDARAPAGLPDAGARERRARRARSRPTARGSRRRARPRRRRRTRALRAARRRPARTSARSGSHSHASGSR